MRLAFPFFYIPSLPAPHCLPQKNLICGSSSLFRKEYIKGISVSFSPSPLHTQRSPQTYQVLNHVQPKIPHSTKICLPILHTCVSLYRCYLYFRCAWWLVWALGPPPSLSQCLCLAPTYELALQTGRVVERMGKFCVDVQVMYAIRGNHSMYQ